MPETLTIEDFLPDLVKVEKILAVEPGSNKPKITIVVTIDMQTAMSLEALGYTPGEQDYHVMETFNKFYYGGHLNA